MGYKGMQEDDIGYMPVDQALAIQTHTMPVLKLTKGQCLGRGLKSSMATLLSSMWCLDANWCYVLRARGGESKAACRGEAQWWQRMSVLLALSATLSCCASYCASWICCAPAVRGLHSMCQCVLVCGQLGASLCGEHRPCLGGNACWIPIGNWEELGKCSLDPNSTELKHVIANI
eukprot:scaffold149533_cov14-Tisochrysis_lutea.AAC.1